MEHSDKCVINELDIGKGISSKRKIVHCAVAGNQRTNPSVMGQEKSGNRFPDPTIRI
ncbi:MAG: hypothetical protein OIN83_05130 [Candidatus Methanoperedens sp.]|nr:hypothetical protein [Candidatus Methanoperedens sp.]